MTEIIDITANQQHEVFEAMCIKCYKRWFACVPYYAEPMKDWECHHCKQVGGIIRTGQPLDDNVPSDIRAEGAEVIDFNGDNN